MINDGLLVRVRMPEGDIVGVLVATHLIPHQTPPSMGLDAQQRLVQTGPGAVQLKLFALVAHPRGFTFGPIGDVMPLFPDDFPILNELHDLEFGHVESCSGDTCGADCQCGTCPPRPEEIETYVCPTCKQEHPQPGPGFICDDQAR